MSNVDLIPQVVEDVGGIANLIGKGSFSPIQPGDIKIPANFPFNYITPKHINQHPNFQDLWHAIFGGGATHHTSPVPQTAVNQQVLQTLGDVSVALTQLAANINYLDYATEDIANQQLPDLYNGLENEILRARVSAVGQAGQALNSSVKYTNAQVHNVTAALNAAVQHLNAELGQVIRNLQANINKVAAELSVDITRVHNEDAAYAKGLQGAAIAQAEAGDARLQREINQTNGDLQANVRQLNENLGRVKTGLEGDIAGALHTAEAFAVGAATSAAVGLRNQLQPEISALKAQQDECLEPLCDTVTPAAKQLGNLGKVLKGLEGLAAAGLLAGLITAAVEDPEGTAKVVVDATGWVTPLAVDLAQAVGVTVGA